MGSSSRLPSAQRFVRRVLEEYGGDSVKAAFVLRGDLLAYWLDYLLPAAARGTITARDIRLCRWCEGRGMRTHPPSDSSRRRSTSPAPSGFSNKRVAEMARVENPPFVVQRSATSAKASAVDVEPTALDQGRIGALAVRQQWKVSWCSS